MATDNPKLQPPGDEAAEEKVIPIAQEEIAVSRRSAEVGRVRVNKTVQERDECIDEPLVREEVEVQRVAVDRIFDAPAQTRTEGDLLIVPVQEEVLVVEKRWRVTEELHIRKHRRQSRAQERVRLRSERVTVERKPPGETSER